MKKTIAVMILLSVLFMGCARELTVDGKTYKSYGLINQENDKVPTIQYEPCWGNIIWGCLLFETVLAPIYFFGFSLFEPVGVKGDK